ncbi:SGNH/GDSL hydrolase family protein [Nocardioides panaciterrulae]|uniref:Lysophospholipase L1-like esterase n=1 Tax=Nocardioides panaciterrulae TaxID=661492 RepID=A0A7Y9E2S8_9ACTN|nr:SGNH/GDSL hydrolase family protein [Nocardioides panaciterrulae]NYD40204.1 lysophospholipase L1-like esterase [Nocardioides panaciterrulae]
MRQRARRGVAAALLTLALGAATGCSGGPASDGSGAAAAKPRTSAGAGTGRPDGPAPGRSPRHRARYVALGDSYTAAPLVPPTEFRSGCLRSGRNYPARVAARSPRTRLVDVSCSGADTASMTHSQRIGDGRVPPQLDAVTRRTALVTLGIGGNDFGLFGTLVGECTRLRSSDPTGSPCRDRFTAGGTDLLAQDLPRIRDHVAGVVARIHRRAPHARIVVVGYPQIIPAHGTCPRLLPLATGDYRWARRVNEGLASAVRRGSRRADAYVDVFGHTRHHDICARHPWINGQVTDPNRALAYHPFAVEQAVVARLVLDAA